MIILVFGLKQYKPGSWTSGTPNSLGSHSVYYFVLNCLEEKMININLNQGAATIRVENHEYPINDFGRQTVWLIVQHWDGVSVRIKKKIKYCSQRIRVGPSAISCYFENIHANVFGTTTRGTELDAFLSKILNDPGNLPADISQLDKNHFTL